MPGSKLQKEKILIFRVDGGDQKGIAMGHLFRCLRLAKKLSQLKIKILFLSKVNEAAENLILSNGFELYKINNHLSEDKEFSIIDNFFLGLNLSSISIIIDTRGKKERLIKLCANYKIPTIVYEDLSEENISPQIIINPNQFNEYKNLNKKTVCYTGDLYRIFDTNIDSYIKHNFQKKIKKLFLCFGGTDPYNLTAKITSLLIKEFPDLQLKIALGPSFKNYKDIESQLNKSQNIKIYRSENFLPKIMKSADAAITSGGTIMYESVFMCIPLFVIPTSTQEFKEVDRFKKMNVVDSLEVNVNSSKECSIRESVGNFFSSEEKRFDIYQAQKKLALTNGLNNIVEILLINKLI